MAEDSNDYDNVEDFAEHFLLRMAEQYAKAGRNDIADAIYDALDNYMLGNVDIRFEDGQPFVYPLDNTEDYLDPSPGEVREYDWPSGEE